MRPNITIAIPVPYLPIDEYCRITGTLMGTARDMVHDGRFPIRGKGDKPRARVEINMAALTVQALSECNISLTLNPDYLSVFQFFSRYIRYVL